MSRSKTPREGDHSGPESGPAGSAASASGTGSPEVPPEPALEPEQPVEPEPAVDLESGSEIETPEGPSSDPSSNLPADGTEAESTDEVLRGEGKKGRRAAEPAVTPPPPERLEGAVEAVLLAAGEALSAERIRDLLGLPSAVHVRGAIDAIRARWASAALSVEIQDVAGGHRVVTRPEFAEYVRRLWRRATSDRLSQTLLETLSIVAYKQPVARAEIERIRGVQCGETLRGLLERRLVKVAGRSDQPGRPLLYATTTRFLEVFGLAGLEDLPSAKDLARL